MRPVSRLLSVLLALILLGVSALTVSAHDTPEQGDTYGVDFSIDLRDTKATITVGTELTFFIAVEVSGAHSVPCTAVLQSKTAGAYGPLALCSPSTDVLRSGAREIVSKEVEYTVRPDDLGAGSRRTAGIQFYLTFAPGHFGGNSHEQVIFKSNKVPVDIVKKVQVTTDDTSEIDVFMDMTPPARFAEGQKVKFEVTMTTGDYWLVSSELVHVRKQLYDADGDEIGRATTAARILLRPLRTDSEITLKAATYTLTAEDVAAERVEFFYEFFIEYDDLRDDDGDSPNLESDFEESFDWSRSIGPGASPTPTPSPTPAATVVATSRYATITDWGTYIHVQRHDGGRGFTLPLGYLATNGARSFHRRGYIRDGDLARGGQTYAVVRRQADNAIVRMWISPESPERFAVDWDIVKLPPYTVPVSVLSTIKLDETRPVENQLARRFDARSDGKIYVYQGGTWHWIPDIPTFKAEGFYWCDVTAADAGFFSRARIGPDLPLSGTADDPNYPDCHSK